MAASWDSALIKRVGTMLGQDARASRVNFLLAARGKHLPLPDVRTAISSTSARIPYLASRMAVAYIEGVQSQGVVATVKHFMGNNQGVGPQ